MLLFNDTFTNFYTPRIGIAGTDLLEASGLSVALAPAGCCGRALISQGLLEAARARAAKNTDALYPDASDGRPIVFLEPSCLSALREDAPALLRGDMQAKARQVADRCLLLEDFLNQHWERGRSVPHFEKGPETVLVHGHCHQKSMGMLNATTAVLARIPGATVVDLDAGCCGMAGSFGYMRDHYDVSRAIGERKLLPAARSQKPGTVLVATGTSCRAQVEDFAGMHILHPVELLHSLMAEPR